MKKRAIVFVIFIICIISIVIGFTFFKIKKNNIEDNKKSENEIVMHNEINKNDNDVKCNNIEKNPESNQKNNMLDVKISCTNSWTEDNINCEQYNIELNNISNSTIKNWKVILLNNPSDLSIAQLWNSKFTIENNNLIITPETYNNEIMENQKIEIGFIAKTIGKINIDNYKVIIEDKEIFNSNHTINKDNNVEENNKSKAENSKIKKKKSILLQKGTPVQNHGRLSVQGANLVDSRGNNFQLRGVSTHSISAFPEYINKETFKEMRDVWGINVIRIAMYSNPNDGYTVKLHDKVKEAVQYASDLGLYVIIDWHILQDNNPNMYKSEAINFFKEMATEYKDNENILYEICNEPNGNVTWEKDIKPYAEEVISEIRKIDVNSIIIVGTPQWSQDVDIVADNRIQGYSNIMYTLHFYSATHKDNLRLKMESAIEKGIPIFVTEFGISSANGNGQIDEAEGDKWIETLNKYKISWVCWNLSNKNETSAILKSSCKKLSNFEESDFSDEGKWLLKKLKKEILKEKIFLVDIIN
ncbi:MAG: cellulase family glycosylhydrolase [Clostridia bacterium]|nr:cellulase family glycosylhydrolase [Clostridia bacterium]